MRIYSGSPCGALTLIAFLWVAACEPPHNEVTDPAGIEAATAALELGEPLFELTAAERELFEEAKEEFEEIETMETGLGPVFNEAACSTCHTNPVGGTNGRLETRFGRLNVDGTFDPMASVGGSLLQDHGVGPVDADNEYVAEIVPRDATIVAGRITTALFGLGLVDAVPDEYLLHLARQQAATTPRTAGTPNMVFEISSGQMRIGRFGWKSQVPTLFQFSGDAYLNEMGITNPEFPDENCPQGDCTRLVYNPAPGLNDDGEDVEEFTTFMKLLAPPARGPMSADVHKGSALFKRIGCEDCHTEKLVTGPSEFAALSRRVFHPYSDFLLHDMGSLGDGVAQGNATGRQMRTAPLWGLSTRTALLHDGRATSIPAAIAAHDGQGRYARERFFGLSANEQATLLAFLKSL